MEIQRLLDELEELEVSGERWYTKIFGKTLINADDFLALLHELGSSLPEEITTANAVARDRERIVREAHEERAKILEAAREQAQLLISNDELARQAKIRAEEILQQAQVEAAAVRSEAEAWARGLVERLENYISRMAATVDKTKKALATQASSSRLDPRMADND